MTNISKKTEQEIEKLAYSGHLLADVLNQLVAKVKPGVKTIELDLLAEKLIKEAGGTPSFKNYRHSEEDPPFPSSICASINDQLVHAPAGDVKLQSGDIFSIDLGMNYEGLYTDMAVTVPVGKISKEAKKLIKTTKKSLALAIEQVRPGNYITDISRVIQECADDEGFSVNRQLVGHGVGHAVHEDPKIPNFVFYDQPKVEMFPGMVIAIEPMLNIGGEEIKTLDDGWTVVTADGSLCAHFEHTVAVTENGVRILTQ